MNKRVKATKDRVLLIIRETLNIITNVLVPLIAVVIFIVEFIPGVPYGVLVALKAVEDFLYQAFGTGDKIREKIEKEFK